MNLVKKTAARAGARFAKIIEGIRRRREERVDLIIAHQVVAKRHLPNVSQWRHLFKITTPIENKLLRRGTAVFAIGVILIAAGWIVRHAALVPTSGGEYREGIVGRPRATNPISDRGSDIDTDVISLVYSSLYHHGADGRLTGDLATASAISPDGKTYTITIRDAVFHDGVPLTADDVAYTFQTIMNPKWSSPAAKKIFGFTVKATDPKTVVFTLDEPNSYFPNLLTVGIIPKHIWEKVTPEIVAATDFNLKPIGSGPYRFSNFTRNADGAILSYTLVAADALKSKIDKITFKFFDDYETAVEKLSGNAVDGLNFIPTRLYSAAVKIPNVSVRKINLAQYTAVFFNDKNQPALSDPKIRQALTMALDRDRIIRDAMDNAATRINSPLDEKEYSDGLTTYAYDPAGAAALLDEAGYKFDAESKVRAKKESAKNADKTAAVAVPLAIELTTVNTEESRKTAQIIKEDWEAVGVRVKIIAVSAADAQGAAVKNGDYQAIIFGEILGEDDDPFPFWHSSQTTNGFNLSKYSNRRVDELLEKARATTDAAAKEGYLDEFQKIITADAAAIFLYSPSYLYPQSEKVKNFSVSSINSPAGRFANITDWYVKKKLVIKF